MTPGRNCSTRTSARLSRAGGADDRPGLLRSRTRRVLPRVSCARRGHLPAAGALDRDDLGARFREKERRERPWQQRREIEDETAVKRLHPSSISTLRAMRNASTPAGMPA